MNQAAVPGTNQITSIQRSFITLQVSTFDSPHTQNLSKSSLALLFKNIQETKNPHFSQIPGYSWFSPSLQPKHHINGCLGFLESVNSDSIKRRARISRITSKMAYHNEWAAGLQGCPPPHPQIFPRLQQTPVLLFFILAGSDRAAQSKFASSKSGAFWECWLHCSAFCLCNPLRVGALTKTSQPKCTCQLFFDQLKQMVGQRAAFHTSKAQFCFISFGFVYGFRIRKSNHDFPLVES